MIFLFYLLTLVLYARPGLSNVGGHDLFTSLSNLKDLWANDKEIVRDFDSVADDLERMAAHLRQYSLSHKQNGLGRDIDIKFLGHPLNAYGLIKHVSMGWMDIMDNVLGVEKKVREKFDTFNDRQNRQLPDENDIKGASYGIARLISLYELNATGMALEGRVIGQLGDWQRVNSEPSHLLLDAWDICRIGAEAVENSLFNAAYDMNRLCLQKLIEEKENPTDHHRVVFNDTWVNLDEDEIRKVLQKTIEWHNIILKKRGNISMGHRTHDEPVGVPAKKTRKKKTKKSASKRFAILDNLIRDLKSYEESTRREEDSYKTPIQTNLLCSGVKFRTPEEEADLRCFYADSGNPWLQLGPIKTEILSYDPYVAAFRELIFSDECDNITEFLSPHLDFPPGRMNGKAHKNDWTMKNTWPVENDNKVLEKLTNRVEAVMDLKANSLKMESDNFMCGNYGIGGHYGTHPDFHPYSEAKFLEPGSNVNRISTVMAVLQAPDAGGATVFPYAGAYAYPEKGTGIGWYNLMSNGFPDQMTKHAACPVILGQKWIGNKWIGYTPQIHKKPCSLKPMERLSGPLPKFKRTKI